MSHESTIFISSAARSSGERITAAVPTPRCPISVRPATVKDIPFIDQLQRMHDHMAAGHVLWPINRVLIVEC